jgi:lysophospholipase L1-like esterase
MNKKKSQSRSFPLIIVLLFVFSFLNYSANAACPSDIIKIMPLGDSITYGVTDANEVIDPSITVGYRQKLYLELVKFGYNVNFVGSLQTGESAKPLFDYDHEGHRGGWRDDQIAANIYNFLTQNPADIVLLHIGTNDLDTNPADVEQILNEIDRYSVNVIVILARIINRQSYSLTTTKFNDNVEKMALNRIAKGDKILLVDMESALDYTIDMADNVHPNSVGYEKMADVWLEALLTILPLCEDAIGIFRKGAWYLDSNGNDEWESDSDTTISAGSFGLATDLPVLGDWDGSGFTNIGVFRNGAWYLDFNGNGKWDSGIDTTYKSFGLPDDIPITGDWNGDGKTNIGVFRKGAWYLDFNGNGKWDPGIDITYQADSFGYPDDIPVTGDWNGDGKTNIGVFRKGAWYLDFNGSGKWDKNIDTTISAGSFGLSDDIPVTGDWNGDGKTNIGVFRKGVWYLDYSGNDQWDRNLDITIPAGSFSTHNTSDIPIVGLWKKKLF